MQEPEQAEPDPSPPSPRFSYVRRGDGSLLVSYGAAPVVVLRGRAARRLEAADAELAQQLMARAVRIRAQRRTEGSTGSR